MTSKFKWLSGDANPREYGGSWYRQDSELTFTVIEMVNMEESCGFINLGKYLAIISEVDISNQSLNARALEYCGLPIDEDYPVDVLVGAITAYGPMQISSHYGNNYHKLLAAAKRWA